MSKMIVKASAGTGKTYRLALEYIARLLSGDDYSEILFMTFTRSATAELKGRIFDFLKKVALEGEGSHIVKDIMNLYPNTKLNIDEASSIHRKLLLNKDKLKIFTIDSFTGNIFKKAIGPFLNVYTYGHINSKDEERIYKEVFGQLVDGSNFDKIKVFLEKTADRNVDKYLNLIKKVSEDRWKFSLIEPKKVSGNSDILKDELFKEVGEVFIILKELVEVGKKELEKCLGPASKKLYSNFGTGLYPSEEVIKFMIENLGDMRSGKYYNGGQTRAAGVAYLKEKLEDTQTKIWKILDSLVYYEQILPYEKDIIEIESIIRDIYDNIKFKDKGLTFADITNYTSEYMYHPELDLVENGIVTENFYEIVGGKITTLFLDEAQDTSVSQWRIIEPIAKACKNIIVVGDEKQSIYSWRGGEKNLFMSMGDILGAAEDNLPKSYRSEHKIIDFVNHFFTSVHKNNEDWKYLEVECNREEEKKGFVGVLTRANHDEDPLSTLIAKDIHERFYENYQGIGIISRKIKTLDSIGSSLKHLGIPYITENSLSITSHPCIEEVLRILRYILKKDYFSLMEFYRGRSIGIGDSHMNYLLHDKINVEKHLSGNLSFEELKVTGDKKVLEDLENLLKLTRELIHTDYELLGKTIIETFNFIDYYKAPRDMKNINFFLDLMNSMGNLSEFLNYLNENEFSDSLKQVGISELNSVVLMSIHKSKGLEFHTEYMYIEDKASKYKMSGYNNGMVEHQLSLMTKFDEKYEKVEDYLFSNSIFEKNIKSTDIYKHLEKTYLDEEINALYVGMTRPVANLILCLNPTSTTVKKVKTNVFRNEMLIVPIEKYFNITAEELLEKGLVESGALLDYPKVKETAPGYSINSTVYEDAHNRAFLIEDEVPKHGVREEEDKLDKVDKEENNFTYDVGVELRRKEGLAIHYFLETLENLEPISIEKSKKLTFLKYGNMLGDTRLKDIMERSHRFLQKNTDIFHPRFTVYKELELRTIEVREDGSKKTRTHIIDRLNVDHSNGEIIIYDYKSGRTMDPKQLERYEKVVLERLKDKTRDKEYKVIDKHFLTIDKS